ncbi:DNA-directed RNA polymerase subunit alpha, partial [Bienertia sinuspersici]
RLQLERNRIYHINAPNKSQDGNYPIDTLFMLVLNVNHSIHSYGNGNEIQKRNYISRTINTKKEKKTSKSIFIDQLELLPRIYNCLTKSNIDTLLDLLNNSQEDLSRMEHFA